MTPFTRTGKALSYPYSLSRWTDVPASKWAWFQDALKGRSFYGVDPATGVPCRWSLRPEDTLGLIFWTKDPSNLIRSRDLLREYPSIQVHVTVTGWEEVERGAPSLERGAHLLGETAKIFGPQNTFWRFSPVPLLSEVVKRFDRILPIAQEHGLKQVYTSFLQPNDRMGETRSTEERQGVLWELADHANRYGVEVLLCNEDTLLQGATKVPNLCSGVCAPPEYYSLPNMAKPPSEGCGCVLMVDPFNINESCSFGCAYCYAADKSLSPKRKNTTLPIFGG